MDKQTFLCSGLRSRRHPSGGAVLDEIASLSTPGLGARCLRPLALCNRRCCTYTSAVSRLLLETPLRRCCWTRSRDPAVLHTSACRDAVGRSPLQRVLLCPLTIRIRTRTHAHVHRDRTTPESPSQFSWTFQGVRREQSAVAFRCVRSTFLAKGLGPRALPLCREICLATLTWRRAR